MLRLHYDELIGKIEEHEEKKLKLYVSNYMLDRVLNKIKTMIGIGKFDNTRFWLCGL